MEPSQSTVEASSPAAPCPPIMDQATVDVHSEALPIMDKATINVTDVHSEALPTIMDQAKIDIAGVHSEAISRVEKLAVQDEHPPLPTKLLAVSTPDSVLERNSSAFIRHKQQDSSPDLSVDVVSQIGVQKRLTGLQNPLQCGSEALASCSMSSSSQPTLVS